MAMLMDGANIPSTNQTPHYATGCFAPNSHKGPCYYSIQIKIFLIDIAYKHLDSKGHPRSRPWPIQFDRSERDRGEEEICALWPSHGPLQPSSWHFQRRSLLDWMLIWTKPALTIRGSRLPPLSGRQERPLWTDPSCTQRNVNVARADRVSTLCSLILISCHCDQ